MAIVCECTVATIAAFCGGVNASGLDRELSITCQDELLAIPAPASGTHSITTAITYRAADPDADPDPILAGKFYKWAFAKKDSSYESERDPETGLWKTQVKIFIQKLESEKTYTFNGLTGENLVCLVKDRNGKLRLIGSLTNGAMVNVKEVTNPQNGYEVTILWESEHAPYFYTSTITY
jgi:hypothetical protein